MNNRSRFLRGALVAGLLAAVAAGSAGLALSVVGWWIDSGDQPVKSDVLVVLSGDYERQLFAARLFAQGCAPEIWISRPRPQPSFVELEKLGVGLPSEEAINRRILLKSGVPESRVHFYGRDVVSTADEAMALRREFPFRGKKILVVTSRYHARRSRLIFRRLLPEADVRVAAPPYADAPRPWWKDKELAENAPLEIMKTLYYLAGGRMK